MQTANEAWTESLCNVVINGEISSPRGIETKEVLGERTEFDMQYPLIHNPTRKLSSRFRFAEAYWITSGSALVEEIEPYNRHISQFSDDGYIFNGAYGPMFASQFEYVCQALNMDQRTRQAWMTIWHPNPVKSKDHKCTIALGWYIRDKKIHCMVTMRSNDLFLGRPYDWFNFTMMTVKVMHRVYDKTITLGTLTQFTGSAHIYADKYNHISRIITSEELPQPRLPDLYSWEEYSDWLIAGMNQ